MKLIFLKNYNNFGYTNDQTTIPTKCHYNATYALFDFTLFSRYTYEKRLYAS